MKINGKALSNAFAALGAGSYIFCYVVAAIVPGLYKAVAQSWFHMIDLSVAWRNGPSGFVLGLVSFTIVSWVSGWLIAECYNFFLGKGKK